MKPTEANRPREIYGFLVLCGWHGSTATRVIIVGSTPKRYRIRALTLTRLPRRGRWLKPGDETLVPLTAVRVEATSALPPREDK